TYAPGDLQICRRDAAPIILGKLCRACGFYTRYVPDIREILGCSLKYQVYMPYGFQVAARRPAHESPGAYSSK
ncbi:hypothetical protein, partial [Serratia nevei]|uniref:hypothetical protein n=1 Tax=Serratia nevei TaxID=2703794 RepID=UPI003F7F756A